MPKKKINLRFSSEIIKTVESSQQIEKDIPPCQRRVLHDGKFYCLHFDRAHSFSKMRELPTLEICRRCKLIKHRIPESTKVKQPISQDIRNPKSIAYQKANMIYCINGGLWVFPSKCEKCVDRFTCKNYLETKQN